MYAMHVYKLMNVFVHISRKSDNFLLHFIQNSVSMAAKYVNMMFIDNIFFIQNVFLFVYIHTCTCTYMCIFFIFDILY